VLEDPSMVQGAAEVVMRILFCLVLSVMGAPAVTAEPLRVGVVIFEGFLASEVVAPVEVFAKAAGEGSPRFDVFTVGASGKPVRSHEGLLVQPRETFASAPSLDILVVPSSMDLEGLLADPALVGFIKERGIRARYLASHCAGAFLLGKAGFLDGKRATTYIGGAERLQKMFPKSRVEGDRHVVVDGNLVTTIGGAVSYEGSLALLERIAGPATADRVAAALYYFRWKEKKLAAATAGAR
jgi:transcriptional regulator GlxA family with amidase domain